MKLKFNKVEMYPVNVEEGTDKSERVLVIFYDITEDESNNYLSELKCEVKISSIYNFYVNTKNEIPSIEYTATINKVSVYRKLSRNCGVCTYIGFEIHPFWNFIPETLIQNIHQHAIEHYQKKFFVQASNSNNIYEDSDINNISINLDKIATAFQNCEIIEPETTD